MALISFVFGAAKTFVFFLGAGAIVLDRRVDLVVPVWCVEWRVGVGFMRDLGHVMFRF